MNENQAQSLEDLLTNKQLGMLNALAREKDVDLMNESEELLEPEYRYESYDCSDEAIEELMEKGSNFIALDGKQFCSEGCLPGTKDDF